MIPLIWVFMIINEMREHVRPAARSSAIISRICAWPSRKASANLRSATLRDTPAMPKISLRSLRSGSTIDQYLCVTVVECHQVDGIHEFPAGDPTRIFREQISSLTSAPLCSFQCHSAYQTSSHWSAKCRGRLSVARDGRVPRLRMHGASNS